MKVNILSQNRFIQAMVENDITPDNVESKDAMFISVNCTPDIAGDDHKVYFKEDKPNVKILFFDDVEKDLKIPTRGHGSKDHYTAYAMTEQQAGELLDFIVANKEKAECNVHCMAGVSRSGAIGTFIHELWGSDTDQQFKINNPHILPNSEVLRLLRNEARNRGLL